MAPVTYKIYQKDKPDFSLTDNTISDPKEYRNVYSGIINAKYKDDSENAILERLFMQFNQDDRPNPTGMHSMSISDIIMLQPQNGQPEYYVCRPIGFSPVSFDASLCKKGKKNV